VTTVYFITHPDVVMDPSVPIQRWPLSERGRARMQRVLELPWAATLALVLSSDEQKALDGAEILVAATGAPHRVDARLGETDRSATGFLPPDEFWRTVADFFGQPEESVRGWERALDAQARIADALDASLADAAPGADVAVVSHGGVGALLLCRLAGEAISLEREQPAPPEGSPPGSGGGCYFAFDAASRALLHGWRRIDP